MIKYRGNIWSSSLCKRQAPEEEPINEADKQSTCDHLIAKGIILDTCLHYHRASFIDIIQNSLHHGPTRTKALHTIVNVYVVKKYIKK